MAKRMPIPPEILNETLDDLAEKVPTFFSSPNVDPMWAYGQLNHYLEREFGKKRETDLIPFSHRPWYTGIYAINPQNLQQASSLPWKGPSDACDVFFPVGAIWKAMNTGSVVYIPDVEEQEKVDPNSHVSCTKNMGDDEKMRGTEVVIPLFGPVHAKGRFKGQRTVIGAWDIDLNVKRLYGEEPAASNHYVQRLDRILREPGERFLAMLYKEEAPFEPAPHIYTAQAEPITLRRTG